MAKFLRITGFVALGLVSLLILLILALDPPPLRLHQPKSAALYVAQTDRSRVAGPRPTIETGISCRERLQADLGHGFTRPIVTFQDWLIGMHPSAGENLRVLAIRRSETGGAAWALRYDKTNKQICWLQSRDVEAGVSEENCLPVLFDGTSVIQAAAYSGSTGFNGVVFDKGSFTATIASQGVMGAMILYLDCFYPK